MQFLDVLGQHHIFLLTAAGRAIQVRTDPPTPFEPETLVGGGPWLLHEGAPAPAVEGEPYAADFREKRHPRTAIGVHADGRILPVTVDGRQPGWSDGMTLAELTALMGGLGCRDALNLDGGGSTTMVVMCSA